MFVRIIGHAIDRLVATNRAVRSYGWSGLFCMALVLLVAAGNEALAGGVSAEAEAATVSAEEAAQLISSPEAAVAGEGLFNQVCVYCHGANGIGGKARKMQCRQYEPQYLFDTISNGKKRGAFVMPSWKRSYDEKTRWELASYIMTLKDLETCN